MHRMRRLVAMSALALLAVLAAGRPADASLILNPATRSFPDISAPAQITDVVNYAFDPSTQTGQFHLSNLPYVIVGGANPSDIYDITPDGSGIRSQTMNITLDSKGNVISSGNNSYSLIGTVDAGGKHYSGVLLTGTPTQFGSADLSSIVAGSSAFDAQVKVTGGLLQKFIGPDFYLRTVPELESTFQGRFDQSFSATKAGSNTRAYHSPQPFPVPEPTTLVVLLIGGAGVAYRHRRRLHLHAA